MYVYVYDPKTKFNNVEQYYVVLVFVLSSVNDGIIFLEVDKEDESKQTRNMQNITTIFMFGPELNSHSNEPP